MKERMSRKPSLKRVTLRNGKFTLDGKVVNADILKLAIVRGPITAQRRVRDADAYVRGNSEYGSSSDAPMGLAHSIEYSPVLYLKIKESR